VHQVVTSLHKVWIVPTATVQDTGVYNIHFPKLCKEHDPISCRPLKLYSLRVQVASSEQKKKKEKEDGVCHHWPSFSWVNKRKCLWLHGNQCKNLTGQCAFRDGRKNFHLDTRESTSKYFSHFLVQLQTSADPLPFYLSNAYHTLLQIKDFN
jgi:hypothetical protein